MSAQGIGGEARNSHSGCSHVPETRLPEGLPAPSLSSRESAQLQTQSSACSAWTLWTFSDVREGRVPHVNTKTWSLQVTLGDSSLAGA